MVPQSRPLGVDWALKGSGPPSSSCPLSPGHTTVTSDQVLGAHPPTQATDTKNNSRDRWSVPQAARVPEL